MNKRMLGSAYEDAATAYLKKNGFRIIERNYRCKIGEIDIIAMKDSVLRFVEVKYRKDETFGNAVYSVNSQKLSRLYRIAEFYLKENTIFINFQVSFDVLAITGKVINYIENCYGVM